jgi:hypothetical protein
MRRPFLVRPTVIALPVVLATGCELLYGITESPSGTGGGAASPPFCASQADAHYFCADFDEGDPGKGWSFSGDTQAPLTSGLDDTVYVSSPASFRASVPIDAGMCASARVREWLPSGWQHVRLQFEFSGCMGAPVGAGSLDFVGIECAGGGSATGLIKWGLCEGGEQVSIFGGGTTTKTQTLEGGTAATDGGFTHVEIDATRGMAGTVRVALDGVTVADGGPFNLTCAGDAGNQVWVGIRACQPGVACTAHFDNVVIDVQ